MLTTNILQFLTDLALNPVDFSVNLVYEFLQGDSDPDVNIVYSTLLTLFHVQYKLIYACLKNSLFWVGVTLSKSFSAEMTNIYEI